MQSSSKTRRSWKAMSRNAKGIEGEQNSSEETEGALREGIATLPFL
ncbi:hypothetical protein ANCCAN_08828 [Ancylostoma caninum]|uniref:Uncharacterized protein n=1 Tax=Ancylostoma caninum TaxID=29170 RepID=A0A368GL87_ANCCA|nr:hypothetical protein ANCCAN_08828 [Ancylostoma caninum]